MGKNKGPRVNITIECKECRENLAPRSQGVSRYLTSKNRRTTPQKLELLKYCKHCDKRTIHKETK